MENTEKPMEQHVLSILLIMGVFVIAIIFLTCTYVDSSQALLNWTLVCPILTVLMAGYVFTYRGKAHLIARIIFAVLIILSILGLVINGDIHGMGAGFTHG